MVSNGKFRSFLTDIMVKRMDRNKEESHMLQALPEEMDQLSNEEVAERWLQILRFKTEDILDYMKQPKLNQWLILFMTVSFSDLNSLLN